MFTYPLRWHGVVYGLNFKSAERSQENLDILCGKGHIMESLQRPHSDNDVATELAWRSIAFLRSLCLMFLYSLTTLSLQFHGDRNACTALHDVRTALTAC